MYWLRTPTEKGIIEKSKFVWPLCQFEGVYLCVFVSMQYLGCVEVFESRGIQVCEEAITVLRNVGLFLLLYVLSLCHILY